MKNLTLLIRGIGLLQLILGLFYLLAPGTLLQSIGHSLPQEDIYYPLAMLAARFIAVGLAFLYIARDPVTYRLWLTVMVMIQAIDLAAGLTYTFIEVVPLSLSAFPMFNAALIIVLLLLWMQKKLNPATV